MKRFAFPEIGVPKQRYNPSLVRAQCARLCRGFSQRIIVTSPLHPLVPWSLSELLSRLSRVSPLGGWIPKAGRRHVKPGVRLLPSESPRGVEGQARSSLQREYVTPSVGPGSGARARSPRPALLLFAELCGWDLVSTG